MESLEISKGKVDASFWKGKKMLPMQAGDVHQTFANTTSLERDYNYKPQITVDKGIKEFVLWYKSFYKNNN